MLLQPAKLVSRADFAKDERWKEREDATLALALAMKDATDQHRQQVLDSVIAATPQSNKPPSLRFIRALDFL